jgi:ferric-dicitrate binding protein FerR (iron transport regulator)
MDAKLVEKYITGFASQDEKKDVWEWIEQSDENMNEYMSQCKLYILTLWRTESLQKVQGERKKTIKFAIYPIFKGIIKIAAIFIIAVVGVYYWMNKEEAGKESTMECLYTPPGQRAELTLEDGTHVWLNANSKITYPSKFKKGERSISLQGEAFFNVAHDAARPFTVNAKGYQVQVLGTEFDVLAYDDENCEVDLLQGKVHIVTPDNKMADLLPGERIFALNGHVVKGNILHPEYFRWRDGLICFDNVTIGAMVDKLERYYGVEIKIANKKIESYRYTGKFWSSDGIEHVLNVLKLDHKFSYSKDNEKNLYIIY